MVTSSLVPIAPVRSTPAESAPAHKPVILLVEDESAVRAVTRQVLEHAGYQVLESDGPQEALRLAAAHHGRIALLLSDVVMPGMNGIELARCIHRKQPWLVAVFMSGYANSHVLQQAEGLPCSIYMQKPFTVDRLLACVARALAKNSACQASFSELPA